VFPLLNFLILAEIEVSKKLCKFRNSWLNLDAPSRRCSQSTFFLSHNLPPNSLCCCYCYVWFDEVNVLLFVVDDCYSPSDCNSDRCITICELEEGV